MKVLIISHNCFSTTLNMGKALSAFFCEFKSSELMQLYLYPSKPNLDVCSSYFRITDNDILKSIFVRKTCGRVINHTEIKASNRLFDSNKQERKYRGFIRNSFFMRRVRDLIWRFGNWQTKDIFRWLDEGRPDIIFYALGDATFSQNIAMWAAQYLNIPLITLVCDEYYFYLKSERSRLKRMVSISLIKNLKKVLKKSRKLITVCDDLGEVYEEFFKTPCKTMMTGNSFQVNSEIVCRESTQISYIGNVETLNRWKSLIEIAEAINEINEENGTKYSFTYYGSENEHLREISTITYGGWLSSEQVREVMYNSCLLIHTETFDEMYRERLRYSISTKIADSLSSGIGLFAYGPEDIASMKYLIKNKCAMVATSKTDLFDKLRRCLFDIDERKEYISRALLVAHQKHDSMAVSEELYDFLQQTLNCV